MSRPLAIALSFIALLVPSVAKALQATTEPQPPVAVSAAASLRQALIVAPAPGGGAMASDGEAYAFLLRRLGFALSIVVADDRPALEAELRRFAASVKPGAEVVVLVLGVTLSHGTTLYLVPSPANAAVPPSLLASEGVPLDTLLRRIGERGPKEIVAIVDICRPAEATDSCRKAADALPDGVSALIASRHGGGGGGPIARVSSLRSDLLPLLTKPDMSLLALYDALKGRLGGTDMMLEATPSLSRSFAFLPAEFLANLPTLCNGVEATSDAGRLRGRHLEELQPACAEAARIYDFSPFFADKLRTLREQIAFSRALVAGCGSGSMPGVLRDFPNGELHGAAEQEVEVCESQRRDAARREQAARDEAREQAIREAAREEAAREQVIREQAAREQVRRDADARREAEYRAMQAEREAINHPDATQICTTYLRDYFMKWSLPNNEAMIFISNAYASFATYYGKTLSRDAIVQEKSSFAARWPQRDYKLLDGSRFERTDGGCLIKGMVQWRASRPTGKTSEGVAEFEVSLALNPTRIVAETGRVLSRGP